MVLFDKNIVLNPKKNPKEAIIPIIMYSIKKIKKILILYLYFWFSISKSFTS